VIRCWSVILLRAGDAAPKTVDDFLDRLAGPLSEVLPPGSVEPGDDELRLLTVDGLAADADELWTEHLRLPDSTVAAIDGWERVRAEQVERRAFDALVRDGRQGLYREGRRLLITLPAAPERQIVDAFNRGGLPRIDVYEQVRPDSRVDAWCFLCPLCRWPMRAVGRRLGCVYQHHQRAVFYLLDRRSGRQPPRLTAIRGGEPPPPSRADELVALRRPVWRYVTIPGLVELDLADKLGSIPGVEVELWPDLDLVDLEVRFGSRRWRVDVKDWTNPFRLSAAIESRPQQVADLIVVPDHRADQLPVLAERVGRDRVSTVRQFVARVRRSSASPNPKVPRA
jgi:hypothetical protein